MVKVYFATNRIPTGDTDIFGDDALPDRPGNLSIGTASVSLTRATAGRAENKLAHADQVHDVVVYPRTRQDDHQRTAGSSRLVRELTKSIIDGGKDLLIYIHGYDTNFREAVWYGGQIKLQYNRVLEVRRNDLRQYGGWPANGIEVLVLSWPSAGRALAYPIEFLRLKREKWHLSATTLLHELEQTLDDQTRAVQAAIGDERIDDLERRLAEGSLQLPGRIHLLAQSMGARILGHGLSAYVERLRVAGPVEQLVQSAILTGADVDSDAFAASGPLRDLPAVADRVSVYHNESDFLGRLSGLLWRKSRMSRRGLDDPSLVPAVEVVNVTEIAGGGADPLGHYYARMNDRVIADILHVQSDIPSRLIPGREKGQHDNVFQMITPGDG